MIFSLSFIPIKKDKVEELASTILFYSPNIIQAGTYDNNEDVETTSVNTILVTSIDVSEDMIYDITKSLFENLDTLVSTHNAANNISLDTYDVGVPIPFHTGAEKYYKEVIKK